MKKTTADQYYTNYYKKIMSGGIVGHFVRLYHKALEKPFFQNDNFPSVIELGAGNCEHLPFVKHSFEEYTLSDIRIDLLLESTSDLLNTKMLIDKPKYIKSMGSKITCTKIDAGDLTGIKDNKFDRLIAGCLILHLEKPEKALREWRRVVKKGGVLSIYIHSEPGMLLRFSRSVSTVLLGKKLGVDHLHHVYREHKLSYLAIKYLINNVFINDEVQFKSFPIPYLSWNYSLWKVVQIKLKD